MVKYTPKLGLKIGGKMSTEGANLVGKLLSIAVLIISIGMAVFLSAVGISYLL